MQLDPRLCALRDDDAPQRVAQAAQYRALARWRESSGAGALEAELGGFARGGKLEDFPLLAACFDGSDGAACTLVGGLVRELSQALKAEPLGHVPLRHFTDGAISTLLIARSGPVSLALAAIDPVALQRRAPPTSVSYPPTESWEHVLAGRASGELIDCEPGPAGSAVLTRTAITLVPGTVLIRDSQRRALSLRRVEGALVTLRLQRRRPGGEITREYSLAEGKLVHQAAGSARDSRLELAAALLGRMGRTEAAPLLAAMAQEQGSDGLRWQVLRECLALDTAAGFRALAAIAAAPSDPLALPAGALRAQLVERHPVLKELAPCPA